MAIRLKDIARDLGISTVTVSKVLRGNQDISEKTRARVLKRMQELDYKPNMLARGLASGRTYTMGLVVPDLVHPFFAEFAKSLAGVLRESHMALLLASSEEKPELEQQEIRTLLARGVDALLIASSQARLKSFYELGDEKTPFLLVDRNFPYLSAHFVGSDDYKIGCIATEHLIEHGYKRILCLGGETTLYTMRERLRGYRHAIEESGMIPIVDMSVKDYKSAEYAVESYLAAAQPPDAIFTLKNSITIFAFETLQKLKVSVPKSIALLGFDDFELASTLRPSISVIQQPIEDMGRIATEILFEQLLPTKKGKHQLARKKQDLVKLETKLVLRNSCGCNPATA